MLLLTAKAKRLMAAAVALGVIVVAAGTPVLSHLTSAKFLLFIVVTALGSGLKLRLPVARTNLPVSYVLTVLAVMELPLTQLLAIAALGALVEALSGAEWRPRPGPVVLQVGAAVAGGYVSFQVCHWAPAQRLGDFAPLLLPAAAGAYYLAHSTLIAGAAALMGNQPLPAAWWTRLRLNGPGYLTGAAMAFMLRTIHMTLGWAYSTLAAPGMYLIYRYYQLHVERLEGEKRHAAEVADLHLRTIEALALAIEAKDETAHAHLRRVRVYATEIAREMALDEGQIQAIEAAAILHDIGKLAVPEYIVNKPGRLTREEYEKIKVHTMVGAEILERVKFPYPVAPIVRSHHERWDGSGYPDGLKGEAIPIGARILAAVDCLDALTSDRQYRDALPFSEALDYVAGLTGKDFDPAVVEVLKSRCHQLEAQIHQAAQNAEAGAPSRMADAGQSDGSGTGLLEMASAVNSAGACDEPPEFILSIAAARQEYQLLHEVTRDLGNSLSLENTFSLLASRLRSLIPHDTISIYCAAGSELTPQYVAGEEEQQFKTLRIPLGQGLSGWAAYNKRHILNGSPALELQAGFSGKAHTALRSALAVPLEGLSGVAGVLTLYSRQPDAFTADNLRIVLAIASKVGVTIENARAFRQVEKSAGTDQLTGLANGHALYQGIEQRLEQARETKGRLTVLVCDLDGFKSVNDRFGHLAGNQVLQMAGERMRKMFRRSDLVARMGGDEFVVVVETGGPRTVERKCRRLEAMISAVGEEVCGERLLGISIGCAVYPIDGVTAEALIQEADQRMYATKRQRRERAASDRLLDRVNK